MLDSKLQRWARIFSTLPKDLENKIAEGGAVAAQNSPILSPSFRSEVAMWQGDQLKLDIFTSVSNSNEMGWKLSNKEKSTQNPSIT